MPRARCVDPEPSHELETAGEAAASRLYRLRAALGARLPERAKPIRVHPEIASARHPDAWESEGLLERGL